MLCAFKGDNQFVFFSFSLQSFHIPFGILCNIDDDKGTRFLIAEEDDGLLIHAPTEKMQNRGREGQNKERKDGRSNPKYGKTFDSLATTSDVLDLLKMMAICNTLSVQKTLNGSLCYSGESPDEVAFALAAKAQGVTMINRDTQDVVISFDETTIYSQEGKSQCELEKHNSFRAKMKQSTKTRIRAEQNWNVLAELEFTSARARMGMVIRVGEKREIGKFNSLSPHGFDTIIETEEEKEASSDDTVNDNDHEEDKRREEKDVNGVSNRRTEKLDEKRKRDRGTACRGVLIPGRIVLIMKGADNRIWSLAK